MVSTEWCLKSGKGICITPDFEQAILEGDFKASGHFTAACIIPFRPTAFRSAITGIVA